MEATEMELPTIEGRNLHYIKVGTSSAVPTTLRQHAIRVEPDILEYVRRQMNRGAVTGEVIGQAILFQEEMHREMLTIEEQMMSEADFEEEEAFGVRW